MLDSVLKRILDAPEFPVVVSDAEGISVCGLLPKFRIQETFPSKTASPTLGLNDDEWSNTELTIRNALHELSGVSEDMIRKNSTIFELGLDSISVLRLPKTLKSNGIQLNVSDILRDQTVYAMAQSAGSKTTSRVEAVNVEAILSDAMSTTVLLEVDTGLGENMGEIDYIMPVTAGQLYMIRMWQISQGILFYPSFTYHIPELLNRKKLESAWEKLLQQYDVLRTGFIETGSGVVQVVFKNPPNELQYETGVCKNPSNLRKPAVSLNVVEITESSTTLILHIHHALYDGISHTIFVDQLEALYEGQTPMQPNLSFKTFVAQSISALGDPGSHQIGHSKPSSQEDKWRTYLCQDSMYETRLTYNLGQSTFRRRTAVFYQSRKFSSLKELAQDAGVSIDSLLLATAARLYAQRLHAEAPDSRIDQVIFGVYLANRAPFGEDLSSLAAPTLNLLPICVRSPFRALSEIAKDIQSDLSNISSTQMSCVSLAQIYKWTGIRINFFVNIQKDADTGITETDRILGLPEDMSRKGIMEETPNEDIPIPTDGTCDAYLPAIDVEIRYRGDKIDIGVFAPEEMISVAEADSMIEQFIQCWVPT